MRLERLRRPAVCVPTVGVVLLGVALGARLRVADLEDALVRDANAIVAAPRARPVHVDVARPGSFADALREPLRRYERSWERLVGPDARTLVSEVAKGERPLSDLPREVASGLSSLEADLEAVLGASRAERADLGPDHDPFGPFEGTSWLGLMDAARHAAIRIRTTGPASPARALSDCLDGLALGRDAAVSGGLVGHMVRASIVGLLTPACAQAVSASTTAEARAAGRSLRRIREATPSFGAMLGEEWIQVQLLAFGPRLPPEAKDRLLARPRAFAENGSMAVSGVLGPIRSRLAWRELRRLQDRLSAIGMLPAPERDAAFAALGPSSFGLRFLLGDLDGPEPVASYARYSRLDAAAELQLDLLVAFVGARELHERRARWPSSVAELASEGLLTPDEARRLSHLVLDEQRPGGYLRLVLPVPQADAGELAEVVIRLSPRD